MPQTIFHADFEPRPYWWRFFAPRPDLTHDLPAKTSVAIVGGGYTGLSAALALARHGIEATVIEAEDFGYGASTRNGGGVGGAVNVGKSLSGRRVDLAPGEREAIMAEASDAFDHIEAVAARPDNGCEWNLNGRFIGAWTPRHYEDQKKSVALLNGSAGLKVEMCPREEQHAHLNTDLYHGGMLVNRSATINPALLYKGLLDRAIEANVRLCGKTRGTAMSRSGGSWTVTTERGTVTADQVVVATNGYIDRAAPELRRRIVPIFSNIIVTEELPEGLAEHIFPSGRYINDTLRIRSYYRLTPDGRRVLFGGRGRFGRSTPDQLARSLHDLMVERMPDLRGIKVAHAWSGLIAFTFDSMPHVGELDGVNFALGCNGSGIAMMNYLGNYLGERIAGKASRKSAFERPIEGNALYSGNPWFLPAIGGYYQVRDRLDRRLA